VRPVVSLVEVRHDAANVILANAAGGFGLGVALYVRVPPSLLLSL
jgi:hypothetical protein